MSDAHELLERLAAYDSPTLSNAIEAFGVRSQAEGFAGSSCARLVGGPAPVVGRAVTATMGSRAPRGDADQRAALYEQVRDTDGPVLLVVVDLDGEPGHGAFLGEMQATLFSRLGAVGIATNGAVRDLEQLRAMGFAAFAGGISVSHAYAHLVEVGVPVELAGLRVVPGDVLHGDEHGLLGVPGRLLGALPPVADAIVEAERAVLAWVASGHFAIGEILERLATVRSAAVSAAVSTAAPAGAAPLQAG